MCSKLRASDLHLQVFATPGTQHGHSSEFVRNAPWPLPGPPESESAV